MRTLTVHFPKFSFREKGVCIFTATGNCNFSLANLLSFVKQVILQTGVIKCWGFKAGKHRGMMHGERWGVERHMWGFGRAKEGDL